MRAFILGLSLTALPGLALAEAPRVVTDIPAVHSLVSQVMGEIAAPEVLLDRGADAHNYQMRPSQARALQEADLVVWVGPEMTPWLARAIDGMASGAELELLDAPQTFRREFEEEGHDHDHPAPEANAEGHDHEGIDPHAWLDPSNARAWLDLIAARLAEIDPENAATYAANAAASQARIDRMEADISTQLQGVAGRPFVAAHDAYGYFAGHFGLSNAGSVAMGDAAEPGAAHLAELRAHITEDGIVCVFPEAQHDPRLIERLIEGTPARLGAALDPSGSSLTYGPDLYYGLMRDLAGNIAGCLGTQ
ncbi:zinc ABC transporter substrate-binding protein [Sinirhodobacter sp. WL0062]|uniref:High-affinity zinc uptake system protein ZnuA n=1 Tax=Rhodobacter flavimaris TaxID=2907145 RepID=A0ABS8Z2U9_9RHOB|nr:zinc ABC transporter substrate-binding protein [Sinirhodobacter sp. WL0062]MCE5974240.1 zinc ABC transporter substrate-binding protein [Sinirhodobacter sp. WL0062]